MTIVEGNTLIKWFMGNDTYKDILFCDNYTNGRFHSSWDWLMPVVRKINTLEKGIQFAIFKTYVSCTVEKGGKFYKDFSFSHAEYITETQSDIVATWLLVVKFIEHHNEKINDKNFEVTE